MINNREAAISETLKWEGGYSNVAADPGGPTNYGITIYDARKYWKPDATAADVKSMPKSIAINIYRSKYWKTPFYDCDKLAAGVDLAVFDFGVLAGPSRAKRYLDISVGGTAEQTINKLCDNRLSFLKGLHTWPVFGKGWSNRVTGIRKASLQMAADALKQPKGSQVLVGTFASLTAAMAASYHWLGSHKALLVLGGAFAALALYETIFSSRKSNVNQTQNLVQ